MKIALGSDHAGFEYKKWVRSYLEELGHSVVDCGTDTPEPCDYPDFCHPAAKNVASGACHRGIVFGGSGNGEAIVANRHHGVRCGVVWNLESCRLTRLHNNANMIAIGQRMVNENDLKGIIDTFLGQDYEGGRHDARILKIDNS